MELSEENVFSRAHNLLWQQRRRREALILITLLLLFHVTGFWNVRLSTQSEMIHSIVKENPSKQMIPYKQGKDRVLYNSALSC